MRPPKVSVIIPSYNHCRYLPERIDSVLGQTFGDFEVIILDDASTDGSHAVLARYHAKPRVRVVVNTRNSGSAFPQWNRGIGMAKGEYVWIAESDDSADPHFLETLVPILDDDPALGLVYCQSRLIDTAGAAVGTALDWTADLHPTRWATDFRNDGTDEVRRYLTAKNTIPNASAVLSRRAVALQALPVDASFKLCGDWLHWGKILLRSHVAYVARPLNRWRLRSSNSRRRPDGLVEWDEGQRVLAHFARALDYSEADAAALQLRFAQRCLAWAATAMETRVKAVAAGHAAAALGNGQQ
jgi:glycosyltransferase involved in cell wall biosynthesis